MIFSTYFIIFHNSIPNKKYFFEVQIFVILDSFIKIKMQLKTISIFIIGWSSLFSNI